MNQKKGLYFLDALPKVIRRLIWDTYLGEHDRWIVRIALHICSYDYDCPKKIEFARYCALNGYLSLLKWSRVPLFPHINEYVARGGNLKMLKWTTLQHCENTMRTCAFAATNGHLEMLKWLVLEKRCKVGMSSISNAAAGGHLDVITFLHSHMDSARHYHSQPCTLAAKHGHLDTLIWLREHDYALSTETWLEAEKAEQWDCLQWLMENGCPEPLIHAF